MDNAHSENWSINYLTTKCVVEEKNLKSVKVETINLVGSSKGLHKGKWQNKKHKTYIPKNIGNFKKKDMC